MAPELSLWEPLPAAKPGSSGSQLGLSFLSDFWKQGKGISAGKARRPVSIKCISQQPLHLAAALRGPGKVGGQQPAGRLGWFAVGGAHIAATRPELLGPSASCSPTPQPHPFASLGPGRQLCSEGDSGTPETTGWVTAGKRHFGSLGPLCPDESHFWGLGRESALVTSFPDAWFRAT